jgi:putative heme iron utilization protein
MVGVTMNAYDNVYNKATGWGTFLTLILLAGILVLDVWLMSMLPVLQHGLGYAVLQLGLLGVFLMALRLIFRGGSRRRP